MYWNLFAEETRKINIIIKIFWNEKKEFLPLVKVPDNHHGAVITKASDLGYKPEVKEREEEEIFIFIILTCILLSR